MATSQQPQTEFVKAISRLDATALVVGSMIGSGIFIVSAEILREVHAPGFLLLVWGVSGIVTLMGALTYGELAAMFPKAGGQYVYLRESAVRRSLEQRPQVLRGFLVAVGDLGEQVEELFFSGQQTHGALGGRGGRQR